MARGQPFTLLCQAAAKLAQPSRCDLHAHTTASDGDYTPSQLVVHARNARLAAIAITDHDTTAGIEEAGATARSFANRTIEVIAGVEISTYHAGQDYHLLGFLFDESGAELRNGLCAIRERRRERFQKYLAAFAGNNVAIVEHRIAPLLKNDIAVGRRHLAKLLVESGHANTLHIAFLKHINPARIPAAHSVPIEEAIHWLHAAGGIASLAHPPSELTLETLASLQSLGLDAVEANFPTASYGFSQDLALWARDLGLGVTAGSDYHGNGHVLGSRTVTLEQLDILRSLARRNDSAASNAPQHS
jgi:predicted metal-dependent phosphoesterase TrpH